MRVSLKPVRDQVMVITGASSGIGLATAKLAARRGAKVVLAARNKEALDTIVGEIAEAGGEAISYALDVAKRGDVEKLAEAAVAKFGRIDTWVNNAGVGVWGKLEEVSDEDNRQLFDTNFWGVVNGSLVAIKHMKTSGGALINLGSLASDMAFALQAMYATTKHAIKGFTDGLRQELLSENAPISVTLIRPAAIGTPFGEKAKNYLDKEPQLPPPVYKPEDVAQAIVFAAENVRRDIYVGGGSRIMSAMNQLIPGTMDKLIVKMMGTETKNEPARPRRDNLFQTASEGREYGRDLVHAPLPSLYTRAVTHPVTTLAVVAAAAGLTAALTKGIAEYHLSRQDPKTRVKRWLIKEAAPRAIKYGGMAALKAKDFVGDEVAPLAWKYGRRAAVQARDYVGDEVAPRAWKYGRRAASQAQDYVGDELAPAAGKYAKRARKQARSLWKRYID